MNTLAEVDSAIEFLREAGCRVLTPFSGGARTYAETDEVRSLRIAAIVDCETTGLSDDAEIVQLAIQRAYYIEDRLLSVSAPWVGLNQPSVSIPAEATAIHGITDDDVKGHQLMEFDVAMQLNSVGLLIAHNASFDAPVFARGFPTLPRYAWACSMADVDWKARGYESTKLGYLLQDHTDQHFQGHDAGRDVAAVAEILATPFADGSSPFAQLLASARAPRVRIITHGAPYEAKSALKARGYKWNDPEHADARFKDFKAWWKDVLATEREAEVVWLQSIGCFAPSLVKVDARTRFVA